MSHTVKITPVSVHIGAELHGVDLSAPLSDAEVDAIRDALLTWKVVFFRGQHLDHARHVAFARLFGAPTPAHVVFGGADPDHPEVYSVAKHRVANMSHVNSWRTVKLSGHGLGSRRGTTRGWRFSAVAWSTVHHRRWGRPSPPDPSTPPRGAGAGTCSARRLRPRCTSSCPGRRR